MSFNKSREKTMDKVYSYRATINDCWEVIGTYEDEEGELEDWVATCETETIAETLVIAMQARS